MKFANAVAVCGSFFILTSQAFAGPAENSTRAAIDRIQKLNPVLRAVIAIDPTAIGQAKALDNSRLPLGPLQGVPILLKDNIEARGRLATTAGSLALIHNVTDRDAPLVSRLRSAGAVILGKANLAEWARARSDIRFQSWSAVGGEVRNPYVLDRVTCGSSSGSAVAVASGMVRIAIGTDTTGSITCPASVNGVVGLRPTRGLVSRRLIVPISLEFDTAGPLAATVKDAALALTAIAGTDSGDPATASADRHRTDYVGSLDVQSLRGKRIGVLRSVKAPGSETLFAAAIEILRKQGAVLVDITDEPKLDEPSKKAMGSELRRDLDSYLASTPISVQTRSLADVVAFNRAHATQEMGFFGQDRFELALSAGSPKDKANAAARAKERAEATAVLDGMLQKNNVLALVAPSSSPAFPRDIVHGEPSQNGTGRFAAYAGYPHLTVPMGQYKGLPAGLSFVGPKWSEATLLSFGYAYEHARGPLPPPRFLRSLEEDGDLAATLRPAPVER